LNATGPPITLDLVMPIPLNANNIEVSYSPADAGGRVSQHSGLHDVQHTVSLQVSDTPMRVEANWRGGLSVEPPTVDLEPGQESRGLRILDFRESNGGWLLLVEGHAGEQYELQLYGERVSVTSGLASNEFSDGVNRLTLEFPAGVTRETVAIILEPSTP
jgi:hypothetical protein